MALEKEILVSQEQQFNEVIDIILQHKSRASVAVNTENLLLAWHVGAYVSAKLKSEEWGSKVVSQLAEYIRSRRPELKGYGRRNIYNMVMFFDEYSSKSFGYIIDQYVPKQIVQTVSAQFPNILLMTTFSNHITILSECDTFEERLFYILYSHKERLSARELKRCINNQTFEALVSKKDNLSRGNARGLSECTIHIQG